LGGQVVAEITWTGSIWQWNRGYVYLGSQLLAVQQAGVNWMHEDPVTKSKRVTNSSGAIISTIELDPWGADTNRSSNAAFQPKKFTSYERDGNGSDEAMFRRYNRWHSRFDQPDPYDGSYSLTDPQSFNRYAYVQGDPVNFVDPTGLKQCIPGDISPECDSSGFGGWGWGYLGGDGWGDPNPGRDIIGKAEVRYNRLAYNSLPLDESFTREFAREFQFFSLWGGSWQQKRVFPHSSGRSREQKMRELNECVGAKVGEIKQLFDAEMAGEVQKRGITDHPSFGGSPANIATKAALGVVAKWAIFGGKLLSTASLGGAAIGVAVGVGVDNVSNFVAYSSLYSEIANKYQANPEYNPKKIWEDCAKLVGWDRRQ
jgi:RHS repeat-associated protein